MANIVLFAATQAYTDSPAKQVEPHQFAPVRQDKIRLLPSVLISRQFPPALPATAKKFPETSGCLEIGEFDTETAKRFEGKVKSAMPDVSLEKSYAQNPSSYMVYLSAAKSKKEAEKRIAELQKKGISNYYLITNGSQFKYAISLGIFKHEDTAKNLVGQLRGLGFEDSDIHVRTTPAESAYYRISNPDSKQLEQLDIILTEFQQASKKACPVENNFSRNN